MEPSPGEESYWQQVYRNLTERNEYPVNDVVNFMRSNFYIPPISLPTWLGGTSAAPKQLPLEEIVDPKLWQQWQMQENRPIRSIEPRGDFQ